MRELIILKRYLLLMFCCSSLALGTATAQTDNPFIASPTENDFTPNNPQREKLNNDRSFEQGRLAFVFENFDLAKRHWLPLVDIGHAKAQTAVAWMYHTGTGFKKNYTKAFELYLKASEQGDATAMNNLGVLYEEGNGVNKNPQAALNYYLGAANLNYGTAQFNYAKLLQEHSKNSEKEATIWNTRAAELGVLAARAEILKWKERKLPSTTNKIVLSTGKVVDDPSYFRNISDSRFTVNVFSSNNRSDIDAFVKKHDLSDQYFLINTGSHGNSWYTLLYGNFNNEESARKGLSQLPGMIRNGPGFVRKSADIKKLLKLRSR